MDSDQPSTDAPHTAQAPADQQGGFLLDLPGEQEMQLRARARLRAEQQANAHRYAQHPWPFIVECGWTLDQATQAKRRYPRIVGDAAPGCPECAPGGCESYLEHLVNVWMREKRLAVPKSRRVIASWTMVLCHYWLARFYPGTSVAFASRKQGQNDSEGAAELVKRAWFVHRHVPVDIAPVRAEYHFCRLRFPDIDSEIIGVAQGADQLRQHTFTAIFADEMAFWEEAHDTYAASLPTLEGGGRFTGISSAHPGFFKQLTFDSLD